MKERRESYRTLRNLLLCAVLFAAVLFIPEKVRAAGNYYTVSVDDGYLALRSAKAYDDNNEIGELYSGETVRVLDTGDSTYWYVYAVTLGMEGYVNRDYLVTSASYANSWTVSVSDGYLALRSAKAYDSANEIGELYSGERVQVLDASDATYWYVYAPSLGKKGYVNQEYLYFHSNYMNFWEVYVDSGYLALRTGKRYNYQNEIGELYTGDQVQVIDSSDSTYWYVYSPSLKKSGYVNADYLMAMTTYTDQWMVSVPDGYLAVRTDPSYDSSNELGELYTGDIVWVEDSSDPQYWYVYAPRINMYGYVNADYLY